MCGIAGLYDIPDPSGEIIRSMCAALVHRGPDEDGYMVDRSVVLGMRRLKVIDLATGRQPIFNEDGTIGIVYNGEIYNFRELRTQLAELGHRFETATDTEVIVHLYEEYGDACVQHLRGMWAFALWDGSRERLLLSRDRLGIKPLYYWEQDGRFAFASELTALLECGFIQRSIRREAVHDYLTYLCVPGPGTIYSHVFELPPGHNMAIEGGKASLTRYWSVPDGQDSPSGQGDLDIEDVSRELKRHIADSVTRSLVSDVPLGVFLSGGLDSALVVAMAAGQSAAPTRTFSVGFRDRRFNELDAARVIARHFGTDHHELVLEPPSPEEVTRIVTSFAEPFADSSAIPTFMVSKLARQYVTVALSGDGGDEVFGGYNNYRADALAALYRKVPAWLRRGVMEGLRGVGLHRLDTMSVGSKISRLLLLADLTPEQGHVWWLTAFTEDMKQGLYRDPGLQELLGRPATRYEDLFFESGTGPDFLNKCMAVDFQTILPNDYLKKADRMSMAHSLELRVPLLDHTLVEFAMRIPGSLKVTPWNTKVLLRKMLQGILPDEILKGRKRGFSIPLSAWLRHEWRGLVRDYLSEQRVGEAGFFEPQAVSRLIEEHQSSRFDHGKEIWTLLCFEIWRREYA